MAKALLGYLGVGQELRMAAELRRLQARLRELETEVARLRAVNEALAESVTVSDDLLSLTVSSHEPALT